MADIGKLFSEGIEVSENVASALEFGGRVLSKVGAKARDGRLTGLELLEIAGSELGAGK